jgi:hypothetical protein
LVVIIVDARRFRGLGRIASCAGGFLKEIAVSEEGKSTDLPPAGLPDRHDCDCPTEARSTWARLIKKIFDADPLLCSCGGCMRIISFITDPRVVDRILQRRESGRRKTRDPFEPPSGASAKIPR